jgi:class 3 adenylate cyclase/tetratricopeptide (TPR) repeat protein
MSTARKTVTILFCDVTGSTALGEELDPESLREVIQRYFAEMQAVIERHGGTVEKFIGDAVMAVFGVPQVHEDDALRAVRAAIDMQARLAQLNDEFEQGWGTRIQARIGVNTGEVVAADPTSGQSFVSGDAVNVAARLEQAAEPGEILLGEPTYRLVRAAVIAETVNPLTVKGKAEPLPAHRLVVVEAGAEILPRRFDSPLVGREAELAAIRQALEDAEAASACRLMTVIGHAGVGKSRLTHEVVASLGERAMVLRGRCLPYGEGITFWPVAEAIQQAVRLGDAASANEAIARIASLLPLGEDPAVADRLAAVLGVGGTAGAIQESFWAIRRVLEALATDRPLVVVFDDIQWGEPTFLDLIQYLATFATGRPIMLLCLARPELLDIRPDWNELGQVVRLGPLAPAESERMVANLLGEWAGPAEVGAQIVESAGGNPLFLEEMLRMLVDDGVLAREDGTWVARGDLSRVGAPDTIQAVIAARLDRLDPTERDVLQRASVVGEVFWWGAVADLADQADPTTVGRSLQALVRRELIRPDPSSFAGEDAFRFGHLLIRDVAYESLPKKVRADLHSRFASWVDHRAGERAVEYEEIVGYHAERAYRYLAELGPVDERGTALAELAADRLAEAGRRAFNRGDLPAAANLLARTIALLPVGDSRRPDLLQTLAVALAETGVKLEEAEATFEQAIEEARAAGDRGLEVRAATRRKYFWMLRSPEANHADALEEMDRAIAAFEELGDDAGLAEALRLVGIVRMWAGQSEEALGVWERAVEHAQRAGDRRLEIDVRHYMGLALDQGLTPVRDAIDRIHALLHGYEDDPTLRSQMSRFEAELEAMGGRLPEAQALIEEGTEVARQLGLVLDIGAGFQRTAGYVAMLAGDLSMAETELRRGFDILERIGDIGHRVSLAADLSLVLLESEGREREILEIADASEPFVIEDDVDAQVRWKAARGRALARLGDAAEGNRLARESVARAWRTDYCELRGLSQVALAEVLRLSGRSEEAAEALEKAVAVYQAKGNVVLAAATGRRLEELEAVAQNPGAGAD